MSDLQPPAAPGPLPPPLPPAAPAWNPYQPTYTQPPGPLLIPASRGSRLAAQLLNAAAGAGILMVCAIPGVMIASSSPDQSDFGGIVALLGGAFGAFVWVVLNLFQLAKTGQSLSKKWMGIKIVMLNGEQPSVLRLVFVRYLLTRFLGMIPFFELVDAAMIFAADQRCIHDHIADTIVVQA